MQNVYQWNRTIRQEQAGKSKTKEVARELRQAKLNRPSSFIQRDELLSLTEVAASWGERE